MPWKSVAHGNAPKGFTPDFGNPEQPIIIALAHGTHKFKNRRHLLLRVGYWCMQPGHPIQQIQREFSVSDVELTWAIHEVMGLLSQGKAIE